MRTVTLFCAAAVAITAVAGAQSTSFPKPEIRPFVGAYMPTGSQRDLFKDAVVAGAQVALELNANTSLLGNFGWTPTKNRLTGLSDNTTNTYMYDLGVELAKASRLTEGWEFKPFVGAGLGGRTYDYMDASLGRQSFFDGYGALGTEFQMGRTALRAEMRDYVSSFTEPFGARNSSTRNDITFNLGFALHLK